MNEQLAEQPRSKGLSTGTAAVILALSSCASYAVGLFRDRLFAHVYGASESLDAFYASFTIPDLLFNLFIAGITAHVVFVPVMMQYFHRKEEARAWRLASSFMNVSTVLIVIVAIGAYFAMPWLTRITAPGFTGEQFDLTVRLTRLMLLQPIIFGISNAFGSILVSVKRFTAYAFAPTLYNLGIMGTTFLFYRSYGIDAAVYGVLVGATVHLLLRLWELRYTSFRYAWAWDIHDPGFKTMLRLVIPKTIGLFAAQANLYAYTAIGSLMATGSIAIYNFAMNLHSFPVSLVGIALATAALPTLAHHAQAREREAFSREMRRSMRYILFLSLPCTAGMLILGPEIVALILRTGAFDPSAVQTTVNALAMMVMAITFENMKHLLARGYYAHQDAVAPVIIAVIGAAVSITVTWFGRHTLGVAAFGLGLLISEGLQVLLLHIGLRQYFVPTNDALVKNFLKMVVATALMSALTIATKSLLIDQRLMILTVASVVVGAFSYLTIAWFLRLPELAIVPTILKKITRRV